MVERIAALLLLFLAGLAGPARGQSAAEPPSVDLQMRLRDVAVRRTPAGDRLALRIDGGLVELDPQEFATALRATQAQLERSGFFYRLFNITKPWGFAWIAVGFLGQALFTLRMALQWWVSERERRSVVPVGFWWTSLLGGILLLVYFVWRKDVVGILGQSTGLLVYARNLVLIHRGAAQSAAAAG